MGRHTQNSSPSPAIGHFRFLSAIQFGIGFLLLFFATYTVMKIHGETNSGTLPYYAGPFMTSVGIIIVSLLGVAIYDIGQHECEAEVAPRVKPLILAHFLLSLFVAAMCISGFILTTVYGLCPSSRCSYTTNETFNFGMAAFLMGMQLLCLAASVLSIVLFRYYKKHLTIHSRSRDRTFSSRADVQDDM